MGDTPSFGEWLRRLRRAQDLTQEALAEKAGCSADTLRAIESGRRRPSRELAALLAGHLAVPADQRERFLQLARGGGPEAEAAPPPAAGRPEQVVRYIGASPELSAMRSVGSEPLIGRADELAALGAYLRDPACRLLTIVGPGGTGKTSIGLHLVRTSLDDYPDGARIVPLAGAASGVAARGAIATTLEVRPDADEALTERIVTALRPRRMLLLLDNLEQLVADDGLVELIGAICAGAPGVKIVATSRQPLRLRAEWVYALGGLKLPADSGAGGPARAEAVVLFLERARRLQASFVLGPDNEAAVVRICRLLEGSPLAIELAAAWVTTLTPAEIAQEIERSLDFLASSERDTPARHRSLRAVFSGSWQLLGPEEQAVLARMALFRGGFTREAAAAVAGARLPQLAALIQQSLLRRSGERFDLHEVIRRFCGEELAARPDYAAVRAAFVAHFLERAVAAARRFADSGRRDAFDALIPEIDNLRAALEDTLQRGDGEGGVGLCTAMRVYWGLNAQFREAVAWAERLLQLPGLTGALQGDLHTTISFHARSLGDYGRSRASAEQAVAAYRAGGDEGDGLAWGLWLLGRSLLDDGEYARARAVTEECVAIRRRVSGPHTLAWGLVQLAVLETLTGDRAAAEAHFAETLPPARASGDRFTEGGAQNFWAMAVTLAGDPAGAELALRALDLLSAPLYVTGLVLTLEILAAQAGMRGRHAEAGRLVGAAQALRETIQYHATAIYGPDYGRLFALARGPLDEATWAAAVAAGRALSLAEAAALARATL